jgi:hypothetical protein
MAPAFLPLRSSDWNESRIATNEVKIQQNIICLGEKVRFLRSLLFRNAVKQSGGQRQAGSRQTDRQTNDTGGGHCI